ncbi:ImmA/IrrE family metallo-endopeptidase [Occultella kanbiaonis]|uniref:ImmA/IrrE family metallo-endopeptidase n=1 Tax=Occultella kanbiaonis TaxID=2675754 RepID=UPI001A98E58E|nr:ImmA/IrrE family metallo-endopeptidase [Occultella kanbiaonis]
MQRLMDLAHAQGLRVMWRDLGRRRGEYRHTHGLIVLSTRLTGPQALSTFGHELGHAHYGDEESTPPAERRADRHAARLLITPGDYAAAEAVAGPHAGAIARELGITRHLVEVWQDLRRDEAPGRLMA